MQPFHAAGAADGVDAAALAAAAGKPGDVDRRIAGPAGQDRAVAPFAGEATGAFHEPAVNDHPAADTGAQDDAEDHPMAAPGADGGLGQRETIGVVGHQHRPSERGGEIVGQPPSVDARNVGDLDPAACRIDDAGDGNRERRRRLTGFVGEFGERVAEGVEVIGRRVALAYRSEIRRVTRQRRLDRRSADIETDGHVAPSSRIGRGLCRRASGRLTIVENRDRQWEVDASRNRWKYRGR